MQGFAYGYDGSFRGFLTCVQHSRETGARPETFVSPDTEELPLYPIYEIETDDEAAGRLYQELGAVAGQKAKPLVYRGFLSYHPKREEILFRFLEFAFQEGRRALAHLAHPAVNPLLNMARHVAKEVHNYLGFVRFSQVSGVLISEIEPKNRVLPLLRSHFCGRYGDCVFMIYDRTHKEALLYRPRQWVIVPLLEFEMGGLDEGELAFRRLWKTFYHTVSIEARYNPKCRMTHMPKRYWKHLTELQKGEETPPASKMLGSEQSSNEPATAKIGTNPR